MNRLIFLTALCGALTLTAAEPADFRYFRQLAPPVQADAKLLNSVKLDRSVLEEAKSPDDVRLFATDGQEVPFQRERQFHSKTVLKTESVSSRVESFDVDGKRAMVLVDLTRKEVRTPVSNRLEIITPEQNFEKKVSIHGFDGSQWQLLSKDLLFFDRNPRFPIANKVLGFPEGRWQKLRVEIDNYAEDEASPLRRIVSGAAPEDRKEERNLLFRELKIDGVKVFHEFPQLAPKSPLELKYPLAVTSVSTDRAKRATIIGFSAGNLPIHQLEVRTTSNNFNREATLESVKGRLRQTIRLEKISLAGCNVDNTGFAFAEQQPGECRLTILNGDNPPLEAIALTASGPAYHLITLPEAIPARLYYAGNGSPPGEYDIAQTLRNIDVATSRFNPYAPGEPQPNPDYRQRAPERPIGKYVFFTAIGVLLLALVIFIIRNGSKIEQEHLEE